MDDQGASANPVLDVTELINGQRIRTPAVVFLVVATLAMIADGYDLAAMGFVVPQLIRSWHVTPADLVPALSAGIFGLLVGAPIFGIMGDRVGRRSAILACLAIVGVFSLVNMAATSLTQFVVLRFIIGVGIGGLSPNIIALAAEVAPKRWRGLFVIIVNFGVPAGITLPGWVSALFVPQYGWPAVLLVGGVLPLVIAAFAYGCLQESVSFLVQRGGHATEVRRRLRALRPDIAIGDEAQFAMAADKPAVVAAGGRRSSPAKLFAGDFRLITPIFWVVLAANQFTNFFALSWLPTLLQSSGLSTAEAGVSASMYSLGGIGGGLLLIFIIDRVGSIPLVALFLLGAPLIAFIGTPGLSPILLMATIAGAGFCVTGNNFGINAVLGMVYPTAVRSRGTGWAQAFGRLGSLAAQIIGGWLFARHLSMQEIYLTPALVLLAGAAAATLLVVVCYRRFGGLRLDDVAKSEKQTLLAG